MRDELISTRLRKATWQLVYTRNLGQATTPQLVCMAACAVIESQLYMNRIAGTSA